MRLRRNHFAKGSDGEASAWVMNDMVLSFAAILFLMAMVFVLMIRLEEFTEEHTKHLFEVHAEENAQIVYELEKGVKRERMSIGQPPEVHQSQGYQGNYGGNIANIQNLNDVDQITTTVISARLYANGVLYFEGELVSAEQLAHVINEATRRGEEVLFELQVEKETPHHLYTENRKILWDQTTADHYRSIIFD